MVTYGGLLSAQRETGLKVQALCTLTQSVHCATQTTNLPNWNWRAKLCDAETVDLHTQVYRLTMLSAPAVPIAVLKY